ncbi:LRR receptor-like serine/threonine-protein kinase EFR [Hibiscus syriacus]|uniref:LRR receptor-like serine/threonine-protein kinase EFR n=1 Tax=Hibiscus syriacus TaxID=106335 RepID=UPI001921BB86|nr:LRR receptor-like serine/threonine-protein kinase EFR [Hibiscus syriacus]
MDAPLGFSVIASLLMMILITVDVTVGETASEIPSVAGATGGGGRSYLGHIETNVMMSKNLKAMAQISMVPITSNETEIQALLAFKARILIDPYGVSGSWNDSQHFCNGSNMRSAASKSHFPASFISQIGRRPSPYIANLTFLRVINLQNNSFRVPEQLYKISSVNAFSLAANKLQGHILRYIGLRLPNLKGIYLGGNNFSGEIPTSIVDSSGLMDLDRANNALTELIPKNLGSLQNLTILNFGGNLPESSNDLSLLTSLSNCTVLSILWLYQNNLTGVLPDSIGNLSTNLIGFRINSNYISGTIPKEIGNLVGLEYLALHKNMLTGSMPDSIGKLSKLKHFDAYTNRIIGEIRHSLNRLNVTILKEAFSLCSHLIYLLFASNSLTGTLPPEVGKFKDLDMMDASSNKLHGEIPSSLENCVMFESLHL